MPIARAKYLQAPAKNSWVLRGVKVKSLKIFRDFSTVARGEDSPYFSNACSPYATIPEYDAYEMAGGTGTSWELDVNTRLRRTVICRIARLSIACRTDNSCNADESTHAINRLFFFNEFWCNFFFLTL
ncbi:hypothetical protein PUN28_010154 [Cardiocondyla obscurior]|uniref:Uncharacterized protein n=1 Tax=Cardiocondyla obscurior TaxID=286306 RepID=A0AAW2FNX2_9HYME